MISPAVLDKLRGIDTPTICNLIELFEVRPRNRGFMNDTIKSCFPEMPPMVGLASTATFRADAPPRGGDAYSSLAGQVERFAELDGPVVVVFQDLDVPSVAATFGEVMCTTYKGCGAVGLVTSGAGRDLAQVRAIDFPVFTSGSICAHAYDHILQTHVPVRVGGIMIYPGDLLHGDLNGVTTIPLEIAAELADAAEEFIAAENVVIHAMRRPGASPKIFAEANKEKQARIDAMIKRLSRKTK